MLRAAFAVIEYILREIEPLFQQRGGGEVEDRAEDGGEDDIADEHGVHRGKAAGEREEIVDRYLKAVQKSASVQRAEHGP